MNADLPGVKRTDIQELEEFGLTFSENWQVVDHFEKTLADYVGSPYAVATDCCSHGLELCLRLLPKAASPVTVPCYTYVSVPMTLEILNIDYRLVDIKWQGSYRLDPYPVVDAATLFAANSYESGTYMVISFQYQKHLPIGKGGMIFLDNKQHYEKLQRMVRDGRDRTKGHSNDNIKELGYHYHMIPEDAARGLKLFNLLKDQPNHAWSHKDYTDLRLKDFFKDR